MNISWNHFHIKHVIWGNLNLCCWATVTHHWLPLGVRAVICSDSTVCPSRCREKEDTGAPTKIVATTRARKRRPVRWGVRGAWLSSSCFRQVLRLLGCDEVGKGAEQHAFRPRLFWVTVHHACPSAPPLRSYPGLAHNSWTLYTGLATLHTSNSLLLSSPSYCLKLPATFSSGRDDTRNCFNRGTD